MFFSKKGLNSRLTKLMKSHFLVTRVSYKMNEIYIN